MRCDATQLMYSVHCTVYSTGSAGGQLDTRLSVSRGSGIQADNSSDEVLIGSRVGERLEFAIYRNCVPTNALRFIQFNKQKQKRCTRAHRCTCPRRVRENLRWAPPRFCPFLGIMCIQFNFSCIIYQTKVIYSRTFAQTHVMHVVHSIRFDSSTDTEYEPERQV